MLSLGFQILNPIYESTNSAIYRAKRLKDEQTVVLKMLKGDYPPPEELIRYQQEYEITRNLDSPKVVKAYALEKYRNTLIIVLEDFGGESLKNQEKLSISTFLPLAIQLAESLGQIHAAHVIHKDINPANILWNKATNQVKLIDFGIASHLLREDPTFKNPEQLEGTLAYISPEQTGRMNRVLDYRTDLYSLGVTFYELLSGKLPFDATEPLELVHCHIAKTPIPLHQLTPYIPIVLSHIVMKLMAKNVEDRYQLAFSLKWDLEQCLHQLETTGHIEEFVLGQKDLSGQLQIPQKIFGRKSELDALSDAVTRASQGTAEMVFVTGAAGVGKTALVQEIYQSITCGYFVIGKFDQYQRNIPYSALTQALNAVCDYLLTESEEKLTQWRENILVAVGNNGQVLTEVIPHLKSIIGTQPNVIQLAPQETQNRFHLVFQRFFRAICHPEHPLVLFIDNLQWADSASLNLLKTLITAEDNQYVLIIGAYRAVEATHPLMAFREELHNATITTLSLPNLSLEDVQAFVAESLKCEPVDTETLASWVYKKTQGNAFFTHEFLKSLYVKELLVFHTDEQRWYWNNDEIALLEMTSNVLELIAGKISNLPVKVVEVIKLAACIGNQFDLQTLSIICPCQSSEISQSLIAATKEDLLFPLKEEKGDVFSLLTQEGQGVINLRFRFQHDRIQQAAYSLITEADKPAIHLQIGKYLLSTLPRSEERIFEIVDHFNLGQSLISSQNEKSEVARFNLKAGHKAMTASAYEVAVHYLLKGLTFLAEDRWQTDYELTLDLSIKAVTASFLNTDFEQAEQLAQEVIQQARTLLDKIKVYEILIQLYMAQNQMQTALDMVLNVLEMLEVQLEKAPPPPLEVEACFMLPEMTALDKLAAMRMLNFAISPAYTVAPELFPSIVYTMIKLSVEHGNSALSVFGYSTYGLLLCTLLDDIESGYQVGQLAIYLLEKFDAKEIKAKGIAAYNVGVHHWKRPARETIEPLLDGCLSGLEVGDVEFVGVTAMHYSSYVFWVGEPLERVVQQQKQVFDIVKSVKQSYQLIYLNIWRQLVFNLQGLNENQCRLSGEAFDEEELLPNLIATNFGMAVFGVYLAKTLLYYLFKDFKSSVDNAILAEPYEAANMGVMVVPLRNFYYSLALLATYPQAAAVEQPRILSQVESNQEQMKQWATHAPRNYQHRYELVAAEQARVLGQLEASEWYERAIHGARENQYLQEEALAFELAAEFYLGRGMEKIAHLYLLEAHALYQQWGATAKVKQLENNQLIVNATDEMTNPFEVATKTSHTTISATRQRTTSNLLDLDSVLKASQTLSQEIILSKLLEKMMHAVIENAGAQRGLLLLKKTEKETSVWVIEAEGALDADTVTVLQSLPLSGHLPLSVVNYVMRTSEPVVLNNAMQNGLYTEDPYIRQHQVKSILCSPIIRQGQLFGLLYLENNLSSNVFTPTRLRILDILSSQAAISLENALLYRTLEQKVTERTAQLNAKVEELTQTRTELVQSEKMASLGRLVAGFAHELNTPIGVAITTASTLQDDAKAISHLLEQEEVDVDQLLARLNSISESAELTLANLDRSAELVSSFKRTAVDKASEEVRVFEVKEAIEDTINTLYNQFKNTHIKIQVDCPKDLAVRNVPGALEQILTNLLMNSYIHGFNNGKEAGYIRIVVQKIKEQVRVAYSDTGKGIMPENLKRVFEPFFTTHRAHGGSGLGTYICYNLVTTQLQGTMTCDSAPNKGVHFTIDFPVQISETSIA